MDLTDYTDVGVQPKRLGVLDSRLLGWMMGRSTNYSSRAGIGLVSLGLNMMNEKLLR